MQKLSKKEKKMKQWSEIIGWVYIPGFFFGLGGSGTVAYKFYLSINRQQKKENKKKKNKVSFNRHL